MTRARSTTKPAQSLLSYTPSRPFFPRGFLWDEGFHLLPVVDWDIDLAIEVVKSWLALMDEDGWIAREQILGPEATSRVPPQFRVQYPHYANPPTLIHLVPVILSKLTGQTPYRGHPSQYMESPSKISALMGEIYPLFARHHAWFRRTQAGNLTGVYARPEGLLPGEGYRWRGRTPSLTLTSGLDDYPRADPPHPGELHIDALAWVATSAAAMRQVAEYLDQPSDAAMYAAQLEAARKNLDILHWDEGEKAYCDATIDKQGQFTRVCHLGYLSLMPLLLGLMDANHPNLAHVLDLLSNPSRLWSPYGLRSLSKQDAKYGKEENYWRGAIWMNLNVLAALRLADLGEKEGPEQGRARRLALELRENAIRTVYDSWAETGFVWEQYSDTTGKGQRSRAFTGWTACVLLLMGMEGGSGIPAHEHLTFHGDESLRMLSTPVMVGAIGMMIVIVALRRRMRRVFNTGLQWIRLR